MLCFLSLRMSNLSYRVIKTFFEHDKPYIDLLNLFSPLAIFLMRSSISGSLSLALAIIAFAPLDFSSLHSADAASIA